MRNGQGPGDRNVQRIGHHKLMCRRDEGPPENPGRFHVVRGRHLERRIDGQGNDADEFGAGAVVGEGEVGGINAGGKQGRLLRVDARLDRSYIV